MNFTTAVLSSVVFGFLTSSVPRAQASDNVILVVVDDFGVDKYDDTAAAPGTNSGLAIAVPRTPHLRALAESGLYFRHAYTSLVCSPTRANLQTGRYPGRTGIGVGTNANDPGVWSLQLSEWTLPEMLNSSPEVGPIATGFFGKWHLSNSTTGGDAAPNQQGYDFAWHTDANLLPYESYYEFTARRQGVAELVRKYATTATVDEALQWMTSAPEPFFAVVSLHAPHAPFHAPPWGLYRSFLPALGGPGKNPVTYYNKAVEALDQEIGRMLDSLGDLRERTNVIVIGDNGTPPEASVPPFLPSHAKDTPYAGSVHVPLIVNGPAVSSPGREVQGLVHAVDLFATIGDLIGVNYANFLPSPTLRIDSISLAPYIVDDQSSSLRTMVYTERFRPNGVKPKDADSHWQGAFDGRYRLLRVTEFGDVTQLEMFDLSVDPFETQNLLLSLPLADSAQLAFSVLTAEMAAIVNSY